MRLLIIYASTDGQTRKIAQHAFRHLSGAGHTVALLEAGEADGISPEDFDGAILAGSLHAGTYQTALADFARKWAASLGRIRTMFLSVSLTAAGDDPDDWAGLKDCVAKFAKETGWAADRVEHVAGAFRFGDYGFFTYWAMRWIAKKRDETIKPGESREYTDWAALERALSDWAALAEAA